MSRRWIIHERDKRMSMTYFTAISSPSDASWLCIDARGQWELAYRSWRVMGRPGFITAPEIWKRYNDTVEQVAMGVLLEGRIGSICGFTFYEHGTSQPRHR